MAVKVLRVSAVRLAAGLLVFVVFYLLGVWIMFGSDVLGEGAPRLFSYSSTLEEYRAAIPGLQYEPGAATALPGETITEPEMVTLETLFSNWHPDDTSPDQWPSSPAHPHHRRDAHSPHALRRFDVGSPEQMAVALQYRERELPFVLFNIPELDRASADTFTLEALQRNFGSVPLVVEKSRDNHFMYYTARTSVESKLQYPSWQPPQQELPMTLSRFLRLAVLAEQSPSSSSSSSSASAPPSLHYLTVSAGEGSRTPWLVDALPFFTSHLQTPPRPSFMIVDPDGFKGINCRYGMRGVTAAAHYDGQRNFVAMLRGRKRYVLLPPRACNDLSLLPKGHPSARHSWVDWSELLPSAGARAGAGAGAGGLRGRKQGAAAAAAAAAAEAERQGESQEAEAGTKTDWASRHEPGRITDGPDLARRRAQILASPATEVVLSRGEVLYIPSFWFHYIISQDASIQCNARSGQGSDEVARVAIRKCMNTLPPFSPGGGAGEKRQEASKESESGPGAVQRRRSSFQERSRHFKALDPQWTLET